MNVAFRFRELSIIEKKIESTEQYIMHYFKTTIIMFPMFYIFRVLFRFYISLDEGKWLRLKDLPFPRCHHGCTVSDGTHIYVTGILYTYITTIHMYVTTMHI